MDDTTQALSLGNAPVENRILQGDCTRIMPTLPTQSVDLVVTDPPYLVHYRDRSGRTVGNDDNARWLKPAFREVYRLLKADAFCVSFYGWNHAERFLYAWKDAGFRPVGHIVWVKDYASRRGYLGARHEQAMLLAKGPPAQPAEPLRDVLPWVYTGNRRHPTEKAVEVITPLITHFSQPGELVLDPFLGAGSTAVAAKQCGRRYLGIEQAPDYCRIAKARLAAF